MELRYITQEDIEACHVNVTSADMFREAREYNIYMHDMRQKKLRTTVAYFAVIIFNFIFIAGVFFVSRNIGVPMLMRSAEFSTLAIIRLILLAAYIVLFIYLVIKRKVFSYKLTAIMTLPLVFCDLRFTVLLIMNTLVFHLLEKETQEQQNTAGYPGFADLRITYIREDETNEAEKVEEPYSFEKLTSDVHDMEEL